MADNVTLQADEPATAPAGTLIETVDIGGGIQRQVVQVEPGDGPVETALDAATLAALDAFFAALAAALETIQVGSIATGTNTIGKVRLVDGGGQEVDVDGGGALAVVLDKGATTTSSVATPNNTAGGTLMLAANANRKAATFQNTGTEAVYMSGASGVTTANAGFVLFPGDVYVDNASRDDWYGITATATPAQVRIMEVA